MVVDGCWWSRHPLTGDSRISSGEMVGMSICNSLVFECCENGTNYPGYRYRVVVTIGNSNKMKAANSNKKNMK